MRFPVGVRRWAEPAFGRLVGGFVSSGQHRSGRGVEWQGWRESPQREQVSQLAGPVTQALRAGAEGIHKGAVLGVEVELGLLVRGVDKGRGTAVGRDRAAVRVLS